MTCERCGNPGHSTTAHVREVAKFTIRDEDTRGFEADSFVSNVHSLDNEMLYGNCLDMRRAFNSVVTTSWSAVMKGAWMLGVYEREIRSRSQM